MDEQDRRPVRPLPHSRTCSRRPPPPRTSWILVGSVGCCATGLCDRCHPSPPRVHRIDRIVAEEEPERIGRRRVSSAAGRRILRSRDAYGRLPRQGRRRDTGWMEAPAGEVFVGRVRELGQLERALDATQAGQRHDRARHRGGGHRQDPAGVRAGGARPRRAVRGPPRALDRPGRHGAARTIRSSRPSVRSERSRGSMGRRRARSCGCSRRRWRCCSTARPPRRCCSCSRICTGPTPRRSTWSSSSRTTSTTGGSCCWRPSARTSAPRPSACAGSPSGVRRSGSALVLELGPLQRDELAALLAAHADAPPPAALTDAIVARSEGNPFFAEELLAAAGDQPGELPRGLRDLLLQRVARLDPATQSLLRLAAAAGRDVGYPLLRAVAELPEPRRARVAAPGRRARRPGRRAGDRQLPLPPRPAGGGDLRDHPARRAGGAARAARPRARGQRGRTGGARAPLGGGGSQPPRRWPPRSRRHARRRPSSAWRRPTRTWSGRSRCGTPCRTRPSSRASTSPSSAPGQPSWPARQVRRRARSSSRDEPSSSSASDDPPRAARLHVSLGRYLHQSGRADIFLDAFARAVELAPAQPPSPERAQALAALGNGLMLAWRHDESLAVCEEALAIARAVGARRGRGPGAHGARRGPRLPRPRRRGSRAAPAGPAAR